MKITDEQIMLATDNVLSGVYVPAYLQKMAERGHVAGTPEEAQRLLNIGFKLASKGAVRKKQAGVGQNKYASAESALDAVPLATNDEAGVKTAALAIAQDPTIYQSVYLLQENEKQAAAAAAAA